MRLIFGGLLISLVALGSNVASAECKDLPQSTLQLYSIHPMELQDMHVTRNGLEQVFSSEFLVVRHPLMLMASNVVGIFEISNRAIRMQDGSICGAPEFVRIGFGSAQRLTLLAQPVTSDDCVYQHIQGHRDAHTLVLDDIINQFVDGQQAIFQQGMKALKQTPAISAQALEDQWNVGLQLMVSVARQELAALMHAANVRVDNAPALADLANACGGKIGRLSLDLDVNP